MGANPAETVKEIEDVRDRLTTEFAELQERIPAAVDWGRRALQIAAGSGIAGGLFWLGVRAYRKRSSRRSSWTGRAQQAGQTIVQVVPDDLVERFAGAVADPRVRQWALGLGAAWLLLRLGELRELRRLHRATPVGA